MATSIPAAAADISAPAANTAAVVTYAAVPARSHAITGVGWSYSGAPAGGNLKIEDGAGVTVFTLDVTSGGAGVVYFAPLKRGATNTACIVTLAAGGAGVSGKVSVLGHLTD